MATPLPKKRLFVLSCVLISESFAINMLFPFVAFMVKDFGIASNEREIGYYVGLIASSFNLAQFFSSFAWGRLSDIVGRRPILLFGLFGSMVTLPLFGYSSSLFWAITFRAINGLLNGNVGVSKTYLREITDKTNEAKGFSLINLLWGLGSIIGPSVGGMLALPSKKYPHVFPPGSYFDKHPYLLPCLVSASFSLIGFVTGVLFLKETLGTSSSTLQEEHIEVTISETDNVELELLQKTESRTVEESSTKEQEVKQESTDSNNSQDTETENVPSSRCPCFGRKYSRLSPATETTTPAKSDNVFAVLLKDKGVVTILCIYAALSIIFIIFNEIFSIWAILPPHNGGLGFGTTEIGIFLVLTGFSQIIFQLFLYHRLVAKIGILRVFQGAVMVTALTALVLPFLSIFADEGQGIQWKLWIVLFFYGTLKTWSGGAVFSACFVLVSNSAPAKYTGSVNGLGQTFAAGARSLGPSIGGAIFAWSSTNGLPFPLDYHFLFFLLSIGTALLAWWCYKLPKNMADRK